jgi:glycerol-3-phosphate dehydrogenase (NAD(P)+)
MAAIGIVGAGAFGTAMACVLRREGHEVTLWAREPEVAQAIDREGANPRFLPGVRLPAGIRAGTDLRLAARAEYVLLAPPAQHLRATAQALSAHLAAGTPVVSCSKGIERGTLALMSEVLGEVLPGRPVALLSGPSFAAEIARGLPCAVMLACQRPSEAGRIARILSSPDFRVHPTDDVPGVAIGGAMKNVIAIASGIAAGRRLGENARASLATLGLEESARLGLACGARAETFLGLAGAGDLMLTVASLQSRNTALGVALGEGRPAPGALTEGAQSAPAVAALARRLDVAMPVTFALEDLLAGDGSADGVLAVLRRA